MAASRAAWCLFICIPRKWVISLFPRAPTLLGMSSFKINSKKGLASFNDCHSHGLHRWLFTNCDSLRRFSSFLFFSPSSLPFSPLPPGLKRAFLAVLKPQYFLFCLCWWMSVIDPCCLYYTIRGNLFFYVVVIFWAVSKLPYKKSSLSAQRKRVFKWRHE